MSITIQCQCSRVMTVSDELAGQPTRCPSCGRRHLVPRIRREPATAALSAQKCTECQTHIVRDAEFCHSCGLPTAKPQSIVTVQQPQPQPQFVQPHQVQPHQPMPQPQFVQPQPQPHMQGPFAPQMAQPAIPPALMQQLHPDGPFSRAMRAMDKKNRPASGLAKVSMTCAYLSIVLAMFTALAAVPMVGFVQGQNDMTIAASLKLQSLVKGMAGLVGLFAFVGVFTGFLGMFHFGTKRGGAVLGLVLSFLIGAATVSGVCKLNKKYERVKHHMENTTQQETISDDCRGCCPWSCEVDETEQVDQADQADGQILETTPQGPDNAQHDALPELDPEEDGQD